MILCILIQTFIQWKCVADCLFACKVFGWGTSYFEGNNTQHYESILHKKQNKRQEVTRLEASHRKLPWLQINRLANAQWESVLIIPENSLHSDLLPPDLVVRKNLSSNKTKNRKPLGFDLRIPTVLKIQENKNNNSITPPTLSETWVYVGILAYKSAQLKITKFCSGWNIRIAWLWLHPCMRWKCKSYSIAVWWKQVESKSAIAKIHCLCMYLAHQT